MALTGETGFNKSVEAVQDNEKGMGKAERSHARAGWRKQQAAFLSKVRRHKHGSDSQTSWYVDLEEEAGPSCKNPDQDDQRPYSSDSEDENIVSFSKTAKPAKQDGRPDGSHSERNEVDTDKGQNAAAAPSGGIEEKKKECHIASEEELDVVIDMLSRSTKYTMQAIPETSSIDGNTLSVSIATAATELPVAGISPVCHQSPMPVFSMAFSPNINTATAMHPSHHETAVSDRVVHHRQSDGFLAEGFATDSKTNTWPFRPRHKAAVPQWPSLDLPRPNYGNTTYDNCSHRIEPPQFSMGLVAPAAGPGLRADAYPEGPVSAGVPWSGAADSHSWLGYVFVEFLLRKKCYISQ